MQIPAAPVLLQTRPETESPIQTEESQFWFRQFVKCKFSNLVAATPDAMADAPLPFLMLCHNAKAANS